MTPLELRLARDLAMAQARRARYDSDCSTSVAKATAAFWVEVARNDNRRLIEAKRHARSRSSDIA